MRRLIVMALLPIALSQTSCADSPDRLKPGLPLAFRVAETVFHHTEWGLCASAVYRLAPSSADDIRQRGLAALIEITANDGYGPWQQTPAFAPYGTSIWEGNLASGLSCLERNPEFARLFGALASSPSGYFSISGMEAVVIIAPQEGLLFYSGYD